VNTKKVYLGDCFAPFTGDLLKDRAVHDRVVGPWCSLAAQWRVGAELDPLIPAERS